MKPNPSTPIPRREASRFVERKGLFPCLFLLSGFAPVWSSISSSCMRFCNSFYCLLNQSPQNVVGKTKGIHSTPQRRELRPSADGHSEGSFASALAIDRRQMHPGQHRRPACLTSTQSVVERTGRDALPESPSPQSTHRWRARSQIPESHSCPAPFRPAR